MTMRQLLRPSLITMSISGCYNYVPEIVWLGQTNENGPYRVFGTVYRTFCLIIYLVAWGQTSAAFPYVPPTFTQLNIAKMICYTECLVMFLTSLKSTFSKNGSQKRAFDFWDDKIRPEMENLGIKLPIKKIQKRQRIYVVLAIVITLVNSTCNILLLTGLLLKDFDVFFAAPFATSLPVLIIKI